MKKFVIIGVILFFIASCKKSYVDFSMLPCSEKGFVYRDNASSGQFGLFSRTLWNDYFMNLHTEVESFGVFPRYIHWYIQVNDEYPDDIVQCNSALGIKTIINQDLQSDKFTARKNKNILAEIIDGSFDRHFHSFARRARKSNAPVYYRFGYEMNGNWFPWCEQPDRYIAAWRHVWEIFKKEKADNVVWIFSPSVLWDNSPYLHRIHPYYPGDVYVDIVALDGYNFGDDHSRHHRWQSFEEVFGKSLAMIHSYNKPIWIAEIGCPTDPRRKEWLKEFFAFMDNNCCVSVFLWFNDHKPGEPDFRIQSDPASLKIFREWVLRTHRKNSKG